MLFSHHLYELPIFTSNSVILLDDELKPMQSIYSFHLNIVFDCLGRIGI